MYPEPLVAPMRAELTKVGFTELKQPADVADAVQQPGTTLLVINSVCGCAAANARPGVISALAKSAKQPSRIVTVFAGVDKEATAKARELLLPYPPSSPCIALFQDGKLVHIIERHNIEGRSADLIASNLVGAFESYC